MKSFVEHTCKKDGLKTKRKEQKNTAKIKNISTLVPGWSRTLALWHTLTPIERLNHSTIRATNEIAHEFMSTYRMGLGFVRTTARR